MQEIVGVVQGAEEGSSKTNISSLGIVTDLLQTSMTSKRAKDCIVAFKAFAKVISAKLDVSEVTNN